MGYLRLAWDYQRTECYLKDLQIEPKFRNKGIGTACLAQIKKMAVDAGASVIHLRVFADNPAVGLHQRFGFVETGVDKTLIEMALAL